MQEIISAKEIKEVVDRMGRQITEDYRGKKLLVVGILKGSFIFMADLVRAIDLDCPVEFISASSYKSSTVSSGEVQLENNLELELTDTHILLVEDILDTGRTLTHIKQHMLSKNPASVRICTLLDKPSRRVVDIDAEYIGIEIEDRFVVGYGLDFDQKYRNLPFIGEYIPENISDN